MSVAEGRIYKRGELARHLAFGYRAIAPLTKNGVGDDNGPSFLFIQP